MNANEAISSLTNNGGNRNWVRPVNWRGNGRAIARAFSSDWLVIVPSANGNAPWYPSYLDFVGEWESVSLDVVLDESLPSKW